ncbi:hypothetical protein WJX75_003750 [Coccomyxa subellipsoidea]|uniref:Uncharacterized protein n=1 Tax=Coccomyxa subellipsoidea TaxID=248742 RepID=A0ABR2YNJ2_9CHLO
MLSRAGSTYIRRSYRWMNAVTHVIEGSIPSCPTRDKAGEFLSEPSVAYSQLHMQLLSSNCGSQSHARIRKGHTVPNMAPAEAKKKA